MFILSRGTHIVLRSGEACAEFQWHHRLPYDIVTKPFVEVCADLNVIVVAAVALHVVQFGVCNRAANCVSALRIAFGYLGQYAHRQAHTPSARRPVLVSMAQKVGLLLSPANHRRHHTTYAGDFAVLNGWTAAILGALERIVPNRWFWLGTLATLMLTEALVIHALAVAISS